jgi:hypothetical protein
MECFTIKDGHPLGHPSKDALVRVSNRCLPFYSLHTMEQCLNQVEMIHFHETQVRLEE